MKKLLLTLAIAITGFTAAYAQDAAKARLTPEQKAEKSTAQLQKKLSLTADQKQKVYVAELDKFKNAEEWHKKSKEDKKTGKDQHSAFKKENDAKIDQVLNAEQKKKLTIIQANKKDKKGKHKGNKSAAKA